MRSTDELQVQLQHFQTMVTSWQDQTFTSATTRTRFDHLLDEFRELTRVVDDLEWGRGNECDNGFIARRRSEMGFELADMFLLMLALAGGEDIRISYYIVKKFEINQERTWGEPNEKGYVEHVREIRNAMGDTE
jgi:NTP pyrophosphatase (non-canonical NTP hydrolase)